MKFNERANRWEEHLPLSGPRSKWSERFEWCWKTFGYPYQDSVDWGYHGGYIYIYNEKALAMYLLRWS